MTCGLVNASYSLLERQAVKLTLFASWSIQEIQETQEKTNLENFYHRRMFAAKHCIQIEASYTK